MSQHSIDVPEASQDDRVERIEAELARLRKTLLRHGHAQEHFQQQIGHKIDRLMASAEIGQPVPSRPALPGSVLGSKQLRALLEFDQSVGRLLDLARGEEKKGEEKKAVTGAEGDAPASLREGLDFLQIRLRNLQRSLGVEPIPTLGQPFDDRLHRAESICHRPDLADGVIAEELLPGYLLDGEVARPALVVVNRWPEPSTTTFEEHS